MKRKYPSIHTPGNVVRLCNEAATQLPDGRWVPCRPLGFASLRSRIWLAWLVFTGEADALLWDNQ